VMLSSDESDVKDAIMTHRRTLIAKDNLGVQMLLKERCNKNTILYIKAWGELNNFTIEYEDNEIPQNLVDGDCLPDVKVHFGDVVDSPKKDV